MRFIAILAFLVGCSRTGDDCQRLMDKTWPILREMAKTAGKTEADIDGQKARFLDDCRTQDKEKQDPMMKCVLDAANDDAVRACMLNGLRDYRDKSKEKSKAVEAKLMLNRLRIRRSCTTEEHKALLKGKAGPTPLGPCCGNPNGECPVLPMTAWSRDTSHTTAAPRSGTAPPLRRGST